MNRRDTILIAVLVNMALLVLLFVSAIKPSTPAQVAKVNLQNEKPVEKTAPKVEKSSLDQVDNLLSKFVEQEVKAQVEVAPEPAIQTAVKDSEIQIKPEVSEIIVKQGDTLERIAKNHGLSVSNLMKINNLVDTRLRIGQILYIPKDGSFKERSVSVASVASAEGKYYIVKHGDNPWTIAIKNGIKVEELLRLNNLDESKAKKLKAGDKLKIQ